MNKHKNLPKEVNIYLALIYRLLIIMFMYSLLRIGFYFYNHIFFPGIGFSKLMYILLGGLKFDLVAIVYLNILYIILQVIPFKFRFNKGYQQVSQWIFYLTNAAGFFANLSDFGYYRFTLKRTTFDFFKQFSDEKNMVKIWTDVFIDYWYFLLALILMMYIIIKLYHLVRIKPEVKYAWQKYLIHTTYMLITLVICLIGVRGGWRHSTRPITLSNAGEYVDKPYEMSLVLNTPFTVFKTIKAQKLKIVTTYSTEELNKLYNPVHQPQQKAPFRKLNVVFIIVESLGKEHIGGLNTDIQNGKYKGYTPFLDSLIPKSFTFTHTYANGRKSIDALPSIISGIPSIREPFVLGSYSGNRTTSIATLLRDEGYETAFFHGAPNGSMGFSSYTKLAGIQHYYGKSEYNDDNDYDGIWGIWDEPFLQYMAKTVNTFKQPFFASLFTVSSHHPFKVPEKYTGKFPKGPLPVQEPIGYTDMALKEFFATASTMPWFKNTLFVLCADHATISYLPEYQTIPGYFSIPIIFYYPGGDLVGKTDKMVQQIDIMPTVLNYLNYPKPYLAFGFDAFSDKKDNFVINNNEGTFNFYQGDNLLLYDGTKSTALYDLKKDRLTTQNLIQTQPERKDEMEKLIKAFFQQYDNRMIRDELTIK